MNASEHTLWLALRGRKPRDAVFQRVENRVDIGTPDVCCCIDSTTAWVELKHVTKWPARKWTQINTGLTKEQALWHRAWLRAGGHSWILIRVHRTPFLFDAKHARALLDGLTRQQFEAAALAVGWTAVMQNL